MPRVKRSESPYKPLLVLIGGHLTANEKRLEDVLHCSYGKAHARMKDPSTFTIEELRTICRSLGIPIEELRQAIMY